MELLFVKLTGAGNDFVGVNNLHGVLGPMDQSALARALCDRHFGVGGDGLLILEPSREADFRMMYYNADGSPGGMCGNGGRCASVYAHFLGITKNRLRFEALDYVYEATILKDGVHLRMKNPVDLCRNVQVRLKDATLTVHTINTGSPHIVRFVEDLSDIHVENIGRALREHGQFAPAGTNVNFVQRVNENSISIRTYERGVEAETLACGTGSIASAILAHLEFGLHPPVRVRTRSSHWLTVDFKIKELSITDVTLEGPATIVFSGKAIYDPSGQTLLPLTTQRNNEGG